MSSTEGCSNCRWRCKFEIQANKFARAANNERITAASAASNIANWRNIARGYACPNLNNIDPDYKGREKL